MKSLYNSRKATNGKRYIILHAGTREGFVEGAGLIFATSNKSADYHDNMNATLFEKWFEESLLKALEEPALIILDNASYHSRIVDKSPTGSSTKQEIVDWLTSKNIEFLPQLIKSELLDLVKIHAKPGKTYVVDTLASKYGHKVLRLPPYHCQYNAIEMVWGISKNYYDNHIVLTECRDEEVLQTWKDALNLVTPKMWENCIIKTNQIIREALTLEHLVDDVRPLIITSEDGNNDESDEDNCSNSEEDTEDEDTN